MVVIIRMDKKNNIEKIIKQLISERVIVKNDINYQFSKEFINCVRKVNEDIQQHKRPLAAAYSKDKMSMLTFLFTEAYVDFIPAGTKFTQEGLADKIETMVLLMYK